MLSELSEPAQRMTWKPSWWFRKLTETVCRLDWQIELSALALLKLDKSYLDIPSIITAAMGTQADAIHPGYGFLAENVELPEACEKYGIIFIGPRSETMRQLGDKIRARKIARQCGVPVIEGSEGIQRI